MTTINKKRLSVAVLLITLLLISVIITVLFTGKCTEEEFLYEYYYDRYDGLNRDNFYSRMKSLNRYYSDELFSGDSWVVNEQNLNNTFTTIDTYQTETEVLSLEITNISEQEYEVKLYVLYTPQLSVKDTHYICYKMHVELAETLFGYKITHVELLQNLPVFTGGQEIVLGSEYEEELEHHH